MDPTVTVYEPPRLTAALGKDDHTCKLILQLQLGSLWTQKKEHALV